MVAAKSYATIIMSCRSTIFALIILLSPAINSFSQKNSSKPVITGQTPSPLVTEANIAISITFANLIVADPDYPNGFKLQVDAGQNYTVNGAKVTPNAGFTGMLTVPVRVEEGKDKSDWFNVKISVIAPSNVPPVITGQVPMTVTQGQSATITLSQLTVSDPDDNYPSGFTLTVYSGSNYAVSGATITPSSNFKGKLTVPVSVNDGENESQKFDLKVDVKEVKNEEPTITGQVPLSITQGQSLTISLSHLTVSDPDDSYPTDFTLTVYQGNNYTKSGNTITAESSFAGMLSVPVSVNDGEKESKKFNLVIEVISSATNEAPRITGQKAISITQNTAITIQLFHLTVEDPDNVYPGDFTLSVFPGPDYTLSGTTVKPASDFVQGTLSVGVKVSDGSEESNLFQLKIQVIPISSTPKINGQKNLTMMEDSTLTIQLSDLQVSDADTPGYPKGFTLTVVGDGEGVYTKKGNAVTPSLNLTGFINVGVTVSDGTHTSEKFMLSILVMPVNDPPTIALLENFVVTCEPGKEPVKIFNRLALSDVDNDHLNMAEIGFQETNFTPGNDEILFDFDTTLIRPIKAQGRLFLIGYAAISEYEKALRSIVYNYKITLDANGEPDDISTGTRTVYANVSDGQSTSVNVERRIEIESKIQLDIPTAFTPNGDKANDTWHLEVLNKEPLNRAIIRVYNNRGLLLYEANGFEKDWDGTLQGQRVPVDTYYYTIVVKLPYAEQTFSGVVTVLY